MTIQTTGSFQAFANFICRESNKGNLVKAFDKMNKKGLFSLNVADAPSKFYTMMGDTYTRISSPDQARRNAVVYEEKFVDVTIEGTAEGIPGFSIIGRIVDEDGVRQVTGFDSSISMEAFHSCALSCKHCNTKHRRVSTYAFRNESTGELFQVGNSCVEQYTGTSGDITKLLLKAFGLVESFGYTDADELDFTGGNRSPMYYSTDILCYAFAVADFDGGYRNSRYDGICTRDAVSQILHAKEKIVSPFGLTREEIQAKYFGRVAELLELVENLVIPSGEFADYVFNIKQLCQMDWVSYKKIGMLVSAVSTWYRIEKKKNTVEIVEAYIDAAKIENVDLTVISHRYMDNFNANLVVCHTPDMRRVSFWDNKGVNWESGQVLKVKSAKVKDRREYKGQLTTSLNYLKMQ
jgi:hypothetical protein